ncbi:Uncharacterized protein FKW44_013420 [Caligus rogercresseyi]|uniref:Uncharacterized protein n=1 Tax=Caligus rogercresseyi TaxID=217165 RepID=A0A7T8KAB2_CALRO|nr:Uncharacterized protein FKW44_013420 [Caligus rogercresseyi]
MLSLSVEILTFSLVFLVPKAISLPSGGKCTTTEDCVAPNVCSKWGWCQWTKIYGEEGPTGGRNGQCLSSADCAPRTPYCSKLGFCHGGRLPFDEEQLEVVGERDTFGYINNDPANNSPIFTNDGSNPNDSSSHSTNKNPSVGNSRSSSTGTISNNDYSSDNSGYSVSKEQSQDSESCPGGDLDACINFACSDLSSSQASAACVSSCGQRCPN